MNKTRLGIGILALVFVVGLYFTMSSPPTNQDNTIINSATSTIATSTEVAVNEYKPEEIDSSDNEFTPKYTELDFSKLQGKDRLYTEEEGRYENLSEEERNMVNNIFCRNEQLAWFCKELPESPDIKAVSLISLHDGITVISIPRLGGIKAELYIYDIQNQEILGRYTDSWNTAFGPNYIIRQGESRLSVEGFSGWTLELYRPGMTNFVTIPDSAIKSDLSYLKWREMIFRDFPIIFDGDTITVTIYKHECDKSVISEWAGLPVYCTNIIQGKGTFDLSNLP